ncbi:MAG: ATP-binding protein [Caldimonas sp.]
MSRAFVVVLLGAESTGKTTLAAELGLALVGRGRRIAIVGEVLREFCEREARTPRREEQAAIAAAQTKRIEDAAPGAEIVVADTSALMIAVYSDLVFADPGLYATAEAEQRRYDLTLLTALDLPWQADGLQRDGPQVQGPVDRQLRAALARAGIAFETISGSGPARLEAALASVDRALAARARVRRRPPAAP